MTAGGPDNSSAERQSEAVEIEEQSALRDHQNAGSPTERLGFLRTALETVGTHPLATGTLAVLGVIGFILSVLSFGVDRKESRVNDDQLLKIDAKVDRLNEARGDRTQGIPRFIGAVSSFDPTFEKFLLDNDSKVVFIAARFSDEAIGFEPDAGEDDREGYTGFNYYSECNRDLKDKLMEGSVDELEPRPYCSHLEVRFKELNTDQHVYGWMPGGYVLKGYWSVTVLGYQSGTLFMDLSPVNSSDVY